jgi:hypothetical protein
MDNTTFFAQSVNLSIILFCAKSCIKIARNFVPREVPETNSQSCFATENMSSRLNCFCRSIKCSSGLSLATSIYFRTASRQTAFRRKQSSAESEMPEVRRESSRASVWCGIRMPSDSSESGMFGSSGATRYQSTNKKQHGKMDLPTHLCGVARIGSH